MNRLTFNSILSAIILSLPAFGCYGGEIDKPIISNQWPIMPLVRHSKSHQYLVSAKKYQKQSNERLKKSSHKLQQSIISLMQSFDKPAEKMLY